MKRLHTSRKRVTLLHPTDFSRESFPRCRAFLGAAFFVSSRGMTARFAAIKPQKDEFTTETVSETSRRHWCGDRRYDAIYQSIRAHDYKITDSGPNSLLTPGFPVVLVPP